MPDCSSRQAVVSLLSPNGSFHDLNVCNLLFLDYSPRFQQPQAWHLQGTFCSALPFAINADIRPVGSSLVWGEALTKSLLSCQGSSNLALRNQGMFWVGRDFKFLLPAPCHGQGTFHQTLVALSANQGRILSGAGFAFVTPGFAAVLGMEQNSCFDLFAL